MPRTRKSPTPPAEPAAPPEQRLVGAIDIGSHSIRMAVASAANGDPHVVEQQIVPVAIGAETFGKGRIKNSTIITVGRTLRRFRELLEQYGVRSYRVVATSAVRDAANQPAFIDRIVKISGLQIEVVESIEETRLLFVAIEHALRGTTPFGRGREIILALGGGGTQIIVLKSGGVVLSETRDFGTVRFLNEFPLPRKERTVLLQRRMELIAGDFVRRHTFKAIPRVIVLQGQLNRILPRVCGLDGTPQVFELSQEKLSDAYDRLLAMPFEDLLATYSLGESEGESLRVAMIEAAAFARAVHAEAAVFPRTSFLGALLLDALGLGRGIAAGLPDAIENAALMLGRQYRFDEQHARQTRDLAALIFDQLADYCGLDRRWRIYLIVAALLHDIGDTVSTRAHHKHAHYLILNSEILGLNRHEMALVAEIARYHRGAMPRATHPTYMALAPADRMLVVKLASLLRIADGLDRDRRAAVRAVSVEPREEAVVFRVQTTHAHARDTLMNRLGFEQKKNMFEETFGVTCTLIEEPAP